MNWVKTFICLFIVICFYKNYKIYDKSYSSTSSALGFRCAKSYVGYLEGTIKNKTFDKSSNYQYELTSTPQKHIPFPVISGYVLNSNNDMIASVHFIKWIVQDLYIANHLKVDANYQRKGIAKELIRHCTRHIISGGGYGVFSSSYELHHTGIIRLHEIYWKKYKIEEHGEKNEIEATIVNWDEITYEHYPNHPWLNVSKKDIRKFMYYLQHSGLIIVRLGDNSIVGISSIIDSQGHGVSHIKWYWGSIYQTERRIAKILGNEYVAIPSISKPDVVWDKAVSYIYAKPDSINIPKLDRDSILGWYLDR
tara:strand:+ start:4433 stop:5356 length:924 start_codon:yes stop_codon:yes gene_type:complete